MRARPRSSWSECGILELGGGEGRVFESASSELLVLYRLSEGRVTEVKAVSSSCRIDAGSDVLYYWEGVSASESLSFLETLSTSHDVLHAVALHADAKADEILVRLARRGSVDVRKDALFWLSQRAGDKAVEAIAEAVHEDPEIEVKKQAVFALSQLPADEGVPLLIELAETHEVPQVRKQAFFWLGQSGDPRAIALFERVLLGKR
jgi:HEAT repeat protein